MDPEDQQDLDNDLDSEESQDEQGSGSDDSAPPANAGGSDGESKRINDLMSNWQREQARANRLESELAALKGRQGSDVQQGEGQQPESNEFIDFAREDARRRLYESDPSLKAAGIEVSQITGSSLEEMKASQAALVKMVRGIESRMRNEVLRQHGLDPEVSTGEADKAPSFSQMSDKEFDEFLAQRDKSGRYGGQGY